MKYTIKDIGETIIDIDGSEAVDVLGCFLVLHPRTETAQLARDFFRADCDGSIEEFVDALQDGRTGHSIEDIEERFVAAKDRPAFERLRESMQHRWPNCHERPIS